MQWQDVNHENVMAIHSEETASKTNGVQFQTVELLRMYSFFPFRVGNKYRIKSDRSIVNNILYTYSIVWETVLIK
jgi:hypothetical protein